MLGAEFQPMISGKPLGDQARNEIPPDPFIYQQTRHYSLAFAA
jgi:hypothetical protein